MKYVHHSVLVLKMESAIVNWEKEVFDGEHHLLPNKNELYFIVEFNNEAWSVVLFFEETPRTQGYASKGKIKFLVENAPHHVLTEGMILDLQLGGKKVAKCTILQDNPIHVNDILERLELLELEKRDFREYILNIDLKQVSFNQSHLKKLIQNSPEYPFLFSFVLKIDKEIALDYLCEYYLTPPLEDQVVYHSFLPLFLFEVKEKISEETLIQFIDNLPKDIKNHYIVRNALEEIL